MAHFSSYEILLEAILASEKLIPHTAKMTLGCFKCNDLYAYSIGTMIGVLKVVRTTRTRSDSSSTG